MNKSINTNKLQPLSEESASVQSHLQIIQSVIQRMSLNSSSCKAWSITVVSAILVLVSDKNKGELAWLALLPSLSFFALDAYYLALEKAFRASYNSFIKKLHKNQLYPDDLFSILPKGNMFKHQLDAIRSFSIWGFYLSLILLVIITKTIILQ